MPILTKRRFTDLTPSEFENFTFDVLSSGGVQSLTWRTPGADGGRDIEGEVFTRDFSGATNSEIWYFECKRYSTSLDWPLVYNKVAHADVNNADFLLIVTTSNPSPTCETQITTWNHSRRSPRIRVWRGYELDALVSRFPAVAAKYGLREPIDAPAGEFLALALEISKISQAAYASITHGLDSLMAVEASAALSELFSARAQDMAQHGRFVPLPSTPNSTLFPWTNCATHVPLNDVALRASLCAFRFVTGASSVDFTQQGDCWIAVPNSPRLAVRESGIHLLAIVGIWADLELTIISNDQLRVKSRA